MQKIPKFKSESKEQDFWSDADSTEYIKWPNGKRVVFSNLKPSLKTMSLRLPELMIEEMKLLANKRDVPYKSLIKIFYSGEVGAVIEGLV